LSFEIESRSGQALLAIDARTELIPDKTELALRKWEKNLKMIKIQRNSYFKTLRSRLNWGLDQRN
jgi:NAD+ kinase